MKWSDFPEIVLDPAPMTGAQRAGDACVVCFKKWPRPQIPVGIIPNGDTVRACAECGPLMLDRLHQHSVTQVLQRAARNAELYAPDVTSALLASATLPMHMASRQVVETAMVATARHLQAADDVADVADLPAQIVTAEHAHAWLLAWTRTTSPPAALLREVLGCVCAGPIPTPTPTPGTEEPR